MNSCSTINPSGIPAGPLCPASGVFLCTGIEAAAASSLPAGATTLPELSWKRMYLVRLVFRFSGDERFWENAVWAEDWREKVICRGTIPADV